MTCTENRTQVARKVAQWFIHYATAALTESLVFQNENLNGVHFISDIKLSSLYHAL